jgi:threonine dehydrogenase-like Zn-dependent dehydrogenase
MSTPSEYKKLQVHTLSTNFREATKIITVALNKPKQDEITIKIIHVGINASDINYTAGKYTSVRENNQFKTTYKIIKHNNSLHFCKFASLYLVDC